MSNPVFSVIVCAYNGERYLEQCLDSIVNQTFKDIEIIVVDDGSTDRTGEICQEFINESIQIAVFHQKNAGKSIALTRAIQFVSGEYFSIIDSDDWIDADYFSELKIQINYQIDMLVQGFFLEPVHQCVVTNFKIKNECISGLELINSNLMIHTANDACFSWRILFRREFVLQNSLYPNSEIVIGEDTEMNLRALKLADKVVCIDYAGYHYRANNQGSLMRRSFLSTYEHDLQLQFETRNMISQNQNYRLDMARYYIETILYRVLDNQKNSPDGLLYPDIKRIFHYEWLKESYHIIGKDLKCVIGNRNAYFMNLLIKHRFCLLYYLIMKMR